MLGKKVSVCETVSWWRGACEKSSLLLNESSANSGTLLCFYSTGFHLLANF